MILTFDRQELLDRLTLLKGITRTANRLMPVTRTVRFEINSERATLSANDLEVGAITSLPVRGGETATFEVPKVFLLHAGTLAEILAGIKGQDIDIEIPDIVAYGDSKAVLRKDRIEIGLPLTDPDDFPQVALLNGDNAFTLAASDFIYAVTRTLYASSNDESRYVLTGLFMQVQKGTFHMVGTDGFRIAVSRRKVAEGGTGPALVIPARVGKLMREIIDEHAIIEVTLGEKKAQFVTNTVTIVSRVIAEKYPDFESALNPVGGSTGVICVKRADLLEALKRMAVLTKKEDSIIVRRSHDGVRFDVDTTNGYDKEYLECTYRDATPLAFKSSLKFVLDAVEHLATEEVAIQYRDIYAIIRIDEGEGPAPDYIVGFLPIRGDVEPLKEDDTQRGSTASVGSQPEGQEPSASPATKKQYKVKSKAQ
jgi:DNA polymerase-3 subunit beta